MSKPRYPLVQAQEVAHALYIAFLPCTERLEIAGSVRRHKPDVGDIEFVCIPKLGPLGNDTLDIFLRQQIADGVLAHRLSVTGHRTYGPLNKLLVHVPSGIPLDIFATTAENIGMALVVRTGPREFNVRMMTRFQNLGLRGEAYGGIRGTDGQRNNCPDEETVFRALGWPYTEPWERR